MVEDQIFSKALGNLLVEIQAEVSLGCLILDMTRRANKKGYMSCPDLLWTSMEDLGAPKLK